MHADVFFLMTTILMSGTTAAAIFAWSRMRRERDRIQNRLWGIAAAQGLTVTSLGDDMPFVAAPGNHRVEQLEAQIEAMSQQVDRLAETQEFLSRVLTDRIEQIPDARLRTPH